MKCAVKILKRTYGNKPKAKNIYFVPESHELSRRFFIQLIRKCFNTIVVIDDNFLNLEHSLDVVKAIIYRRL